MKRKRRVRRGRANYEKNRTADEIRRNLDNTCVDVEKWRVNLTALAGQPDIELPAIAKAEGVYQARQGRVNDILRLLPKPKPAPVPEPEPRTKPMATAKELARIKFTKRTEPIIRQQALHVRLAPGDSAAILQDPDDVYWLSYRRKLKTGGISFEYKDIWPQVAAQMIEAFQGAPKTRKARKPKPAPVTGREPEYVSSVRYFHALA